MAINLNTIEGTLTPVGDKVLVSNMFFGEQTTVGGLIIRDDNGTTRGIYPRWGQVHAKGPKNTETYSVGDWILVEHGRWTRSVKLDAGDGEFELRMIDNDAVLAFSDTKPDDVILGAEYSDGEGFTVDPQQFVNA